MGAEYRSHKHPAFAWQNGISSGAGLGEPDALNPRVRLPEVVSVDLLEDDLGVFDEPLPDSPDSVVSPLLLDMDTGLPGESVRVGVGPSSSSSSKGPQVCFSASRSKCCARCLISCLPREQVQQWASHVTGEMQELMILVEAKMDLWRRKMAEKDQVIKHLHWKLLQSQQQPGEEWLPISRPANSFLQPNALRSPGRSHRASAGKGGAMLPGRVIAISAEGAAQACFTSAGRLERPGSLSPPRTAPELGARSAVGVIGGSEDRGGAQKPKRVVESQAPGNSSFLGTTTPSSSLGSAFWGQVQSSLAGSRKLRVREGPDRTQIANLRQEIAHLRRQNADLSGQVRLGEAQIVDNLREMQVPPQRAPLSSRRVASGREEMPHVLVEDVRHARAIPIATAPGGPVVSSASISTGPGFEAAKPVQSSRRTVGETPPQAGGSVKLASRTARRGAAAESSTSERSTSLPRSLSALARQSKETSSRKMVLGTQAYTPSIMTRVFSPRSRYNYILSSRGSASTHPAQAPSASLLEAQAVAVSAAELRVSTSAPGNQQGRRLLMHTENRARTSGRSRPGP